MIGIVQRHQIIDLHAGFITLHMIGIVLRRATYDASWRRASKYLSHILTAEPLSFLFFFIAWRSL